METVYHSILYRVKADRDFTTKFFASTSARQNAAAKFATAILIVLAIGQTAIPIGLADCPIARKRRGNRFRALGSLRGWVCFGVRRPLNSVQRAWALLNVGQRKPTLYAFRYTCMLLVHGLRTVRPADCVERRLTRLFATIWPFGTGLAVCSGKPDMPATRAGVSRIGSTI